MNGICIGDLEMKIDKILRKHKTRAICNHCKKEEYIEYSKYKRETRGKDGSGPLLYYCDGCQQRQISKLDKEVYK